MFVRDLNIINNPYTYYRLDPGEPGIAPPTPASKSAFTVFTQESRNRTRLQAEALIEGKDVVFVNTEYKLRKNGSFITIVGGTTTVITREKDNPQRTTGNNSQPNLETEKFQSNTIDEQELRILEAEEQRLTMEKTILRIKLNTSDGELRRQIEMKLEEIEQKLTEIKNKKRSLRSSSQTFVHPTYNYLDTSIPFLKSLYTLSAIISLYV